MGDVSQSRATKRLMHSSKWARYSITSSARASGAGGKRSVSSSSKSRRDFRELQPRTSDVPYFLTTDIPGDNRHATGTCSLELPRSSRELLFSNRHTNIAKLAVLHPSIALSAWKITRYHYCVSAPFRIREMRHMFQREQQRLAPDRTKRSPRVRLVATGGAKIVENNKKRRSMEIDHELRGSSQRLPLFRYP